MRRKNLVLVAMLSGCAVLAQPVPADKAESREEKLLREAGIGTDGTSLLAYLRNRPRPIAADAERIRRLIAQLGSENFQERDQAARELVACGQTALEPLRKALESRDAEVVRQARACIQEIELYTNPQWCAAAIRLLQKTPPAGSVPVLLETLDHADAQVRRDAFAALRQIVGPKDQQEVLRAVKDKRPYVRAGAIGCSSRYKDQPKVWAPILLEALRDDRAVVRRQAAISLRHFRSEEGVVPALIEALKDNDVTPLSEMSVSRAAASSLEALGPPHGRPVVPGLMELSKAGHELNRSTATLALGYLASRDKEIIPTVVPFLIQLVESEKQPVGNRITAVIALGLVGPDARVAVPALRQVLKGENAKDPGDPYSGIHSAVLTALCRIGPGAEAAVPELTTFVQDGRRIRDDRRRAAEALAAIGPGAKVAVPALVKMLEKDDHVDGADIRQVAAKALGAIGPAAESAIPALTKATKDPDPRVQQAAVEALKRIEQKPE